MMSSQQRNDTATLLTPRAETTTKQDQTTLLLGMNDIIGELLAEVPDYENAYAENYYVENTSTRFGGPDDINQDDTVDDATPTSAVLKLNHGDFSIGRFLAGPDPWSALTSRTNIATEARVLGGLTSNCHCDTTPSHGLHPAQHSNAQASSSRPLHTSRPMSSLNPVEFPTPTHHSSTTSE